MNEALKAAWIIARKDIAIELRTRTAFMSGLVFSVLVLAILYFARDPTGVSALDIAPGALWVTFVFAAMLGLNRAFTIEWENRAIDGLLLTGIPRSAVFLGKFVANLAFVFSIEFISIPLFILFYDVPLWQRLPELALVIVLATTSFVAVGTLLSSMAVRTRFAELMLPLLLLPFLVPPVIGAVQVTNRILIDRPLSEVAGWLKLLAAFDVVFFVLSTMLFEATLDE